MDEHSKCSLFISGGLGIKDNLRNDSENTLLLENCFDIKQFWPLASYILLLKSDNTLHYASYEDLLSKKGLCGFNNPEVFQDVAFDAPLSSGFKIKDVLRAPNVILLWNKNSMYLFDFNHEKVLKKLLFQDLADVRDFGIFLDGSLILLQGSQLSLYQDFLTTKPVRTEINSVENLEIKKLSCGVSHCLFLGTDGKVYTMGINTRGQLGIGSDIKKSEDLCYVETLCHANIIDICAGGWHNLILTDMGDVYAWGCNSFGQLGILNEQIVDFPTLVSTTSNDTDFENLARISCGLTHSAAMDSSGQVWKWGCKDFNQKSIEKSKYLSLPTFENLDSSKCVEVLCGHSCCILKLQKT